MKRRICVSLFRLPSVSIGQIAPPARQPLEVIRENINLPPRPEQGWIHDDVTPLMRVIRAVDPENVLEFGTGHGNTTANVCAICKAHVFTVNALPEQMSGNIVTFSLTKEEIGCVYRKHGFQKRVTQIYENTLNFDCGRYFRTPCIDLAIIDACHDTDYVISDFAKVLPALRGKGTVLLHDTHPSREGHLRGSYDACTILRARGYDIRHIRGTWWAIWQGAGRRRLLGELVKRGIPKLSRAPRLRLPTAAELDVGCGPCRFHVWKGEQTE